MKARLLLTGLALIAFTSFAIGQKTDADTRQNNIPVRGQYADENKNGICDNFENRAGTSQGQGRYCFRGGNRGGRGNCYRGGNGPGQGRGQGRGQSRFYVDKDNNGVCDNFENNSKKE